MDAMSEPSEIANSEQKSQLIEEVKSNSFMEQLRQAKARRRRRKNKSEGKRLRVTVWHTGLDSFSRHHLQNFLKIRPISSNDGLDVNATPRRVITIVFIDMGVDWDQMRESLGEISRTTTGSQVVSCLRMIARHMLKVYELGGDSEGQGGEGGGKGNRGVYNEKG
eukprot:1371397-Amorphochlora_amoeboformis.AAC.1